MSNTRENGVHSEEAAASHRPILLLGGVAALALLGVMIWPVGDNTTATVSAVKDDSAVARAEPGTPAPR